MGGRGGNLCQRQAARAAFPPAGRPSSIQRHAAAQERQRRNADGCPLFFRRSERLDHQIGNHSEVASVQGSDGIVLLQRGGSDSQVVKGYLDAFSRLFTADLANNLRGFRCDRMDGNMPLQLVDELSTPFADLCRWSAEDAVYQFSDRYRTDGDFDFTALLRIDSKSSSTV